MFEIKNLTKSYGRHRVVEDLTFDVPDGTVTGFLGPNGSGKSTTMRCMLGLDKIDRGEALIDGRSLAGCRAPARIVGAMLDAGWMNPKLTARGHLTAVAQTSIDGRRETGQRGVHRDHIDRTPRFVQPGDRRPHRGMPSASEVPRP